MNLRKAENYDIALDIGTGSVGWSVSDSSGNLYTFKGKPTWGSRLFPSAETAAGTRINRGQRRRYDRRRQRLNLLQEFFLPEMEKVDPEFFIRLNQSRLLPEDRASSTKDYLWPLFNDSDFTEIDYYKKFPTIYHLRTWLMETNEKVDLRLIYLAFHNIVKHRGNFLYQDNPKLSAKNANMKDSVELFCVALENWLALHDVDCECKVRQIESVLSDTTKKRSEKQELLIQLFGIDKSEKSLVTALSKVLLGYKVEFANIFFIEANESNFDLSNDEKVDSFLSLCPDDGMELFEALQAVYSSLILTNILSGASGKTISYCKVQEYERYADDLSALKQLVKKYVPDEYERFFRGAKYEGSNLYNANSAEGYTRYNLGNNKISHDDFLKEVEKLFEGTEAEADECYLRAKERIEARTFLRRLKTSDNGSIPYQLHLEEMISIIDKQSAHYPFLKNEKEKIESLVTFRIPYYVGPLTQKNAALDDKGKQRFAWSERLSGKETERVYPWNWEEVIDKDKSAETFIRRMTGTCTYLLGEPVLPRCSLMYEMYCVLNELNGAKYVRDGEKKERFDAADRIDIVEELFKKRKTVSYKAAEDWLKKKHGATFAGFHVSGGQGEKGFESKLSSYNDFCKILGVEELSDSDFLMIEELILWSTLFEDRSILKRRVESTYGDRLNESQVKEICKKRYAGWGRLSKTLLVGLKSQTDNGQKTIMDILGDGDPNHTKKLGRAMNFMEIIYDDTLDFGVQIDDFNAKKMESENDVSLDELQGSPALRRGVNQSLRIIEEIVGITEKLPANIFIEVAREEDERNKGRRTTRRYNRLEEALKVFKKEDPEVYQELKMRKPEQLDERLTLYFMQRGKSMYSGRPLDIRNISSYQVDHIIPQAYIKDDSYENKVLVLPDENQRKLDSLLLDNEIIKKMKPFWRGLLDAKLIGEKKFNNLTRAEIRENQLKGFINRQLVETRQITKQIQQILQVQYGDAKVIPIKAGFSSQLRDQRGLVKCREINDFHHAHDAYIASQIGRFIQYRHEYVFDNPLKMAGVVKKYIEKQGEDFKKTRKMPGSASFIVSSFLSSGFDKETGEIFKDKWDAEAEVEKIRRCLNFKDCFISRMPEETSGAFWDATIYSPRGSSKALSLPLKKGLDPQKYGSFSSEYFAYFFIYSGKDKKDKTHIFFEGLPVSLSKDISEHPEKLELFAIDLAKKKELTNVKILKRKILKYQKAYYKGDEFYLPALGAVYSARQLILDSCNDKTCEAITKEIEVTDSELLKLYDALTGKADILCSRFSVVRDVLVEGRAKFESLDYLEKRSILLSTLQFYNGTKRTVNLQLIGGSANAGFIRNGFLRNDLGNIEFSDSSVTGMFERRYRIGL
jgi:CRISPR-associated endonuclease Csn1